MSNVYLSNSKESTRVVFLIDVAMGRMLDTCERKTLSRAITLTSTRILLCLSKFPHVRYKDILKWNYTFYDSQQTDWSLRVKSGNFLELSTYQLESYSHDVLTRLDSSATKSVKATQPGARLLYNAIGTAIQDYPWDAPFIISPVRPSRLSHRNSRRLSNVEKEQSNVLFVFNYCPTSKVELQTFCGLKNDVTVDAVKSKLFTADLCSAIIKINVKINFINCADLAKQSKSKDIDGLVLYTEVVSKSIGGKVMQLSQFISSLNHELHKPVDELQGCCHHSSSASEEVQRPTSCTLTYPIQTALSTVVPSTCRREENLLKVSGDGRVLYILSVSSMLQDGLPLNHCPTSTSSSGCKEEGPVEAEVVGVIKNIDINLSWFHPTKLYTCVSINSEMCCSRYFQTLNLGLARDNNALIVKMKAPGDCAILQPITSLISSLICVKPEHMATLCALPSTSLTENKLVHADGDTPCCSNEFLDANLFPMEVDLCVNLDRLFASATSDCATGRSESFTVQSFHPCSLSFPASSTTLNSEFYAKLHQLAKREEYNYNNSLRAFKETLHTTNSGEQVVEQQQQETGHAKPAGCTEPLVEVLGPAEAMDQFRILYQQCVDSVKNEEELFQSLTEAVKKLEDSLTTDEMLQFLGKDVLLSHSELRTKHEAIQNASTEKRKINEYQLQALVYLEAHKRGLQDHVTVAEQLVLLLRGISLMADTKFLSRYLTDIILANYLESCSDVLRLLYEELMLPLPVQLGSPALDTSYATSDGESPFCSVTKPLVATSTVEDSASSRRLKRFKSFHGFPAAKKQITVPKRKKATKSNRQNSRSNAARSAFRSVRSPFKSPPHNRIGGSKSVRRSLFARSKSMVSISYPGGNNHTPSNPVNSSQEASHRGIKVDDIVCVQETPLKKQVNNYQQFKLQRTRSKLGKASVPEINTIEESPYRVVQLKSGVTSKCRDADHEREVVSSSDEDFNEARDALLSLYLPSQAVPSPDRHQPEAPTDSMIAFKLTTPPKEARLNFVNVTSSLK